MIECISILGLLIIILIAFFISNRFADIYTKISFDIMVLKENGWNVIIDIIPPGSGMSLPKINITTKTLTIYDEFDPHLIHTILNNLIKYNKPSKYKSTSTILIDKLYELEHTLTEEY